MITVVKQNKIHYPAEVRQQKIHEATLKKNKLHNYNVVNYKSVSWNPVFDKFIFLWTGIVSGDRLINNFANNWITITGKDFSMDLYSRNIFSNIYSSQSI